MTSDPFCTKLNGLFVRSSLLKRDRSSQQLVRLLLVLLIATSGLGCGGPETTRVDLIRVRGYVTLDGNPLEKAVVIFESPDGSYSYSETDAGGRYDLRFDSNKYGITKGAKIVRISMNRRIYGLNSNDEGGPEDTAGGSFRKQPPERIPDRYHANSELRAEVSQENDTYNFDLTTKLD